LIASAGSKTAALLQLLKETGMRVGEASRLRWTEVDLKRHIIMMNEPEKGGNARIFKVSEKLTRMLEAMPSKSERVFRKSNARSKDYTFYNTRKFAARKFGNPRLMRIHFHTLRHWKATMEYHKTKDLLHVMQLLGHKRVDTTLLYIQLEKALFTDAESDDFTVRVARTQEDIKGLLEVGFDYVCETDDLIFFRKRR